MWLPMRSQTWESEGAGELPVGMLVANAQYRKHHAHLLSVVAESGCRNQERLVGIFLQEKVESADRGNQENKVNRKNAEKGVL